MTKDREVKMLLRIWDVTFTVNDLERSTDFFENVLELPLKYKYATYVGFDCGGIEIGLVPGTLARGEESAPLVDFLVGDVDQTWQCLADRGVNFLKEPYDTPWGGRVALFSDPDGNILQLVSIDWAEYFKACAT